MMNPEPFNPLDKTNLGRSVAQALLRMTPQPMPKANSTGLLPFPGAGIYAIYYVGERQPFSAYEGLAERNRNGRFDQPIYVGKAVPKGARKAGTGASVRPGQELFNRLRHHATSITFAENLDLDDFFCRFLVVDDIWIPLGESLFIRETMPLWNLVLDGFGNNAPGSGRAGTQRPSWDSLHPGRRWAANLTPNARDVATLEDEVRRFLAGDVAVGRAVEEAIDEEDAQED